MYSDRPHQIFKSIKMRRVPALEGRAPARSRAQGERRLQGSKDIDMDVYMTWYDVYIYIYIKFDMHTHPQRCICMLNIGDSHGIDFKDTEITKLQAVTHIIR